MSETKVKWHSYPKEKPQNEGNYLVSFRDAIDSDFEVQSYIAINISWFDGESFDWFGSCVFAWAELPEPYHEVDENE